MANIRGLRSRIKGITSTQQITKAMKMVAVAKLRRTQVAMNAMRPFSAQCGQVMHTLCSSGMELTHPLLTPRAKPKRVTYVVVVGNRGLCGAYNLNLLRHFEQQAAAQSVPYDVIVVGRWQSDALLHLPLVRTFDTFSDTPSPQECNEILEVCRARFLAGETDAVYLVYQRFVNALTQEPTMLQLLPIAAPSQEKTAAGRQLDYQFEPDREEILAKTVELYLSSTVYAALLEAKSGEHSARITAMSAASDNTEELIEKLSLELNRARQAQITTEISEIVGGASALEHKK